LKDNAYLNSTIKKIIATRERLNTRLKQLGFTIVPSSANFVFVAPPGNNGEQYFNQLREQGIIVRYFPGEITGRFVRITIGTNEQIDRLLAFTTSLFG
jgi:histidinol-phosphate aminotransferase